MPPVTLGPLHTTHFLLYAGAVPLACEALLLPGMPALQHRAAAILFHLAAEPRGVAAILTPLQFFNFNNDEGDGGGSARSPLVSADASAFTLLSVLGIGVDPASQARDAAAAAADKPGARRQLPRAPEVIVLTAMRALLRCLLTLTTPPTQRKPATRLDSLQQAWVAVEAAAAAPTPEEEAAEAAGEGDEAAVPAAGGDRPPSELLHETSSRRGGVALQPVKPAAAQLWELLRAMHAALGRGAAGGDFSEGLPPLLRGDISSDEGAAIALQELLGVLVTHIGLA